MFWGINLKPNRKYSQTANKAFHISQAALDPFSAETEGGGSSNQIYLSVGNEKFLLCTLRKDGAEQISLDLNFEEGEKICFQSIGSGTVCLSGYLLDGADFDDEEQEEEEGMEDVTDLRNVLNKKPAAKAQKSAATKSDSDSDEEDGDFDLQNALEEEDEDEEGDDDDDEEDDDEDDDSEDEEVEQPKAKQAKLDKSHKQQNGKAVAKAKPQKPAAAPEKVNKKKNQNEQKQQQPGGERTLAGGVKVVDLRIGNGPEAKTGKRAQVYYEGRLKSNNKMFDSMKQGAGFKFGLGRGEVIKGWDVGVVGMKVGGKRRIICPAHMGYGARGSPPTIPPNSTLVFDVELKGVN